MDLGLQVGLTSHSAYALPNNGTEPFAYADYRNDTYTLDGAPTTFDAFLVENLDWGQFTANLVPGEGLFCDYDVSTGPAIEASLAARLLVSGFTARFDWYANPVIKDGHSGDNCQIDIALATVPSYDNFWESIFNSESGPTTGFSNNDLNLPSGTTTFPNTPTGDHRIAVTWDSRGVHFSVDGGAVQGTDDPLDLSLINLIGLSYSNGTVRGIGFYPPQADADLPMISTP